VAPRSGKRETLKRHRTPGEHRASASWLRPGHTSNGLTSGCQTLKTGDSREAMKKVSNGRRVSGTRSAGSDPGIGSNAEDEKPTS
jgi:hypothetical protein